MNFARGLVQGVKGWLSKPIADSTTDPQRVMGSYFSLPNPDPILRMMGCAERVHHSIMLDAHVIGEIRSIRGSFRSHLHRIQVGDEGDSKSIAAADLCRDWLEQAQPNDKVDWLEVMWQMSSAVFTGYRAHEVVWEYNKLSGKATSNKMLPGLVEDRPNRRIVFDQAGGPKLITRANMMGEPFEPYQFVISRHMPTYDNPYGLALMSSCFWPWTFKNGGWQYFVKFCERHGLPWPVGRYPMGTSEEEQNNLAKALESMLESGYAVVQEGNGIELMVPNSGGGALPQERLIVLANREMSKALTSQAMVGEQLEVGSRAAAETAQDRQNSVHDSDRDIGADGMNHIFKWITLFNFGDGVAPPKLEFFKKTVASKDRAEVYAMAARAGARPSKKAFLEELDIPEAEDEADAMLPPAKPLTGGTAGTATTSKTSDPVDFSSVEGFTFARAAGMTEDEAMQLAAEAADGAIEDKMIAPIYQMLVEFERQGKTLAEFQAALVDLVGEMDDEGLREVLDRSMTYAWLRGAATNAA